MQEREGQESRGIVWKQLTSMVAVPHPDAVAASWETALTYASGAVTDQAAAYLLALSDRLVKELKDDKAWPLDWRAGSSHFLDLFGGWASAIDAGTAEGLLQLLMEWAEYGDLAAQFERAAEIMRTAHVEVWQSLINQLVALPIKVLSEEALQYIARSLAKLSDDQKATWITQLSAVLNKSPSDEDEVDRYRKIVDASDLAQWATPPLQSHAQSLADRVSNSAGQTKVISAFFPPALRLIPALPKTSSGNTLYTIFEQAFGIPESYITLHREIKGKWLVPGTDVGMFDGDYLSTRATQFIQAQPSVDGVGHVFESLVEMVDKRIAPETSRAAVAGLMPLIWSWAPDSVIASLSSIVGTIAPAQVASAFAGSKPEPNWAKQIAQAIAVDADSGRRVAITIAILASQPTTFEGQPDGSLWIWAEALGDGFAATFRDVLNDPMITDDQAQRLIAQVLERKHSLGLQFFVANLALLLAFAGRAKANGLAFSQIEEIAAVARNQSQRSAMANALISVLPSCSVAQTRTVASLVRGLGGTTSLEENSSVLAELDDEQLAAVADGFPESRSLRKALHQRAKEE